MRVDQAALIDIVAQTVPIKVLETILQFDGVLPDFDLVIRKASADPEERQRFAAELVVGTYWARREAGHFARLLARRMRENDELVVRLTPFLELHGDTSKSGGANGSAEEDDEAKQARLALTAHFMQSRKLREFLANVEAQICVILSTVETKEGTTYRTGTGFLVGPDLVLTAFHNIKDQVAKTGDEDPVQSMDALQINTDNLTACFDFFDGQPLEYPARAVAPARHVGFDSGWRVRFKRDYRRDGLLSPAEEAAQAAQIGDHLDFALLRLAESVGQQTRSFGGGERRGWVDLTSWQQSLQDQGRIIIPQHPEGYPQRIDFGRFSQKYSCTDISQTRLRYDTETRAGTSGAPCFTLYNSNFHAVGIHNATFRPNGSPAANQAVDLRKILPYIQQHLPTEKPSLASRIWNIGTTETPWVILGRRRYIDWLTQALREDLLNRSQRLYAAKGLTSKSGRSYSIDILRAALQTRTDYVVEFGTAREAMPTTVPDFLKAVLFQLGLSTKALDSLPPAPGDKSGGSGRAPQQMGL